MNDDESDASPDDLVQWDASPECLQRMKDANSPSGPFDTLLGTTSSTSFTDVDAVNQVKRFYQVVSADAP